MELNNHFNFGNNSNNYNKIGKGMEIEFFDNHYKFYQEDDEYYLNKMFSFNDDQNEDEKEQIYTFPFPFCDYEEDKKNNYYNNDNLKLLNVNAVEENDIFKIGNDINSIISNNIKNNNKGEVIMEKISNYISNYEEILHNQTAVKSPNHFDFDKNIKLAENTLPGSIISLMKKEGRPINVDYIYEKIKDKFLSFRKANGAKYNGDIHIVLKSTLNSSGIFYKIEENYYYFKEKESMDFIIKTIERELKKKISKDKKEKKNSLSSKKNSKKKKKEKKHIINELSLNHQLGYKICKLNSILDNMMEKYRGNNNNFMALSKKFHDEGIEMIKNISEKDKFIGMILCIKFFKGIIEKYIKFKNKKINIEKYLDEKKFNEKILKICEKIEKIEQSFNNGISNSTFNDEMSPNLKIINLSNKYMISSDNEI